MIQNVHVRVCSCVCVCVCICVCVDVTVSISHQISRRKNKNMVGISIINLFSLFLCLSLLSHPSAFLSSILGFAFSRSIISLSIKPSLSLSLSLSHTSSIISPHYRLFPLLSSSVVCWHAPPSRSVSCFFFFHSFSPLYLSHSSASCDSQLQLPW